MNLEEVNAAYIISLCTFANLLIKEYFIYSFGT